MGGRWRKNTKYFLNLEKRNKLSNSINELITDDNLKLITPNDILLEAERFYFNLYTKDTTVSPFSFYRGWNHQHSTLSHDQSSLCEGLLSLTECNQALLSMAKNKSPGSDGLPVEFYHTFWDDIGQLVVNSFNCAFEKGYLSDEQGRAIISLIPKPGKDTRYLKNWRPIALLNTDYKIAAKCIAFRLKDILNTIISCEQTGFLKGRFIGENIRLVQDLIWYCNEKCIPGSLIFIDFEKAFDRLDWSFIQCTLSYFNFGPQFKAWVRVLYSHATTCVSNNGYLSAYFKVSRGVRQGCPLSPYLFIICTEILTSLINSSQNIKGIRISDVSLKVSQYADDTVIITDGSELSMCEVNRVLNLFCQSSGLKINFEKSHLFLLGPLSKRRPAYLNRFHYDVNAVSIKYLGITFSYHKDDFFRLNYVPKLSRIKHLLHLWSSRDLTPIGKILLLKTFAVSQLVFLFMVLPNPPDYYLNELNKLFFNFIWNGKPDKVKRSVLCNTKAKGGLNMLDIHSFASSLKTKWVKMFVDDHYRPWKVLFSYALRNYGGEFLFSCNFKKGDILLSNCFIREVCNAWAMYNFSIPEKDFASQLVLNNSCIKVNNKIVYFDALCHSRGYKVGDFFHQGWPHDSISNFCR